MNYIHQINTFLSINTSQQTMASKQLTAKKAKKHHQVTLGSIKGFGTIPKEQTFVDQDILLTDIIYGSRVPVDAHGKLFHYKVTAFHPSNQTFTLKYTKRVIDPDGSQFVEYVDCSEEDFVMPGVKVDMVKDGCKL